MPVYSYACKDCGHSFDQRQSFTDNALTVCPRCAGALRKVFNSVGVVFKGSGFYRTDSRSEGTRGESVKAPLAGAAARTGDNGTAAAPTGGSASDSSGGSKPDGASTAGPSTQKQGTESASGSSPSGHPARETAKSAA
jgi:putative FmdB family regulatory protein